MNEKTLKNSTLSSRPSTIPRTRRSPSRDSLRCGRSWRAAGLMASWCPTPIASRTNICRRGEERLAWLTALPDRPAPPSSSRARRCCSSTAVYTLQAGDQTEPQAVTIEHLVDKPPSAWIEANLKAGPKARLRSLAAYGGSGRTARQGLLHVGAILVATEPNPSMRPAATARPRPRRDRAARSAIRRRACRAKARTHSRRDQETQCRRAGGLRSARGRLDVQHPRPTFPTRRCRWPSRSFGRTARGFTSMRASLPTPRATPFGARRYQVGRLRLPRTWPRLAPDIWSCASIKPPPPTPFPGDHRQWRQGFARPRSDPRS